MEPIRQPVATEQARTLADLARGEVLSNWQFREAGTDALVFVTGSGRTSRYGTGLRGRSDTAPVTRILTMSGAMRAAHRYRIMMYGGDNAPTVVPVPFIGPVARRRGNT